MCNNIYNIRVLQYPVILRTSIYIFFFQGLRFNFVSISLEPHSLEATFHHFQHTEAMMLIAKMA